jgi:hypothetical protein
MHTTIARRFPWVLASACCAVFVGIVALPAFGEPRVATLAGSGLSGTSDGAAASASFVMPAGVAVASGGRIFVADAGANRVCVIEHGMVRTIAGGNRAPGFADGPADEARFDLPLGVAVAADGTVFVADANNHVIRRIAGGIVSTYAGMPMQSGDADGPRLLARFQRPVELAIDRDGSLLVADMLAGLRRISRSGVVTTIALGETPTDHVYGVAVGVRGDAETIYVADTKGLLVLRQDGTRRRFFADTTSGAPATANDANAAPTQGLQPLGFPYALAALDDAHVFYSDIRTNTIRLLNVEFRSDRVVAGASVEDGAGDTGAFADGVGSAARFDAPFGIALAPDGSLVVADGANRRVRTVLDPGPGREPVIAGVDPLPLDGAGTGIALIGTSATWSTTTWDDSVQGILERRLRLRRPDLRIVAVTAPGAPTLAALGSLLETLADAHAIKGALLYINTTSVIGEYGYTDLHDVVANVAAWRGPFVQGLRELDARLAARGVKLAVVEQPLPFEISLTEFAWEQTRLQTTITPQGDAGEAVRNAVLSSGVRTIDAWPAFEAAESAPDHAALWGTADAHFSAAGRALLANVIARSLEATPLY